jgi:rubrerythrin
MSFDQIKDILKDLRSFHSDVAEFYQRTQDQSGRERIKMLLDYMIKREKTFEEVLDRFLETADQNVLETWVQFTPSQPVTDYLASLKSQPIHSIENLVKIASEIDQHLLAYYQTLINTAPREDVREALQNLMLTAMQKEREVLFSAQLLKDL